MDNYKNSIQKKNWSSLMVFNCSHNDCKNLNLDNINNKSAKWFHRMDWQYNNLEFGTEQIDKW